MNHEGTTAYHARYFAHDLTLRKPSADADRLSASLFNATVDLNPHQIDAALFALKSPLSKGVILADEVGLGKTIEAALILCQLWAERRRRLLVVCPASIRKQWSLELEEKFNLPTVILDSVAFRRAQANGNPAPFLTDAIVITSLNFASAMQTDVRAVQWDVVVIDEAHKLRNAYRPSNQMGQRLRWALEDRRKVLLTATPLQNSLLELYGLSTVIDEHIFGDVGSFRSQYMRQDSDIMELRDRLAGFCKRTLRNQVTEYIQYTERHPITRPFQPTDGEHNFYEAVSTFLLREDTYSIPVRQRALTTLILRKLLASSSPAIAGTLETMKERLEKIRDGQPAEENLAEQIIALEELEDDYLDETLDLPESGDGELPNTVVPKIDLAKLKLEIAELERFITWAHSIGVDTKSHALLKALEIGFAEMAKTGAARKALVFTESRRTQEHLRSFLEANGHAGRVIIFNGTNTDPAAKAIYEKWLATNAGTGRASGSRAVDIRTALIEHFRDHADILIATEAAAEGVNIQFCSLVINYDLPWNADMQGRRIALDWYPKIQSRIAPDLAATADVAPRHEGKLTPQHPAFFDWQEIERQLQEFKNERAWFNLNLTPHACRALLEDPGWYVLYIPPQELEIGRFDRVFRWQEIAVSLLKKYCDVFFKTKKAAWEAPQLRYEILDETDENFVPEYRFLIDESAKEIITKLNEVKEAVANKVLKQIEWGTFRSICFGQHLYQPLIYLNSSLVDVRPVALNEGERDFVTDLKYFYENEQSFFEGKELYLLRNLSRGRGIGFFEAGNFYPDFILWLLIGGKQYVSFVDPKGIRNLDGADDPKISFFQTIKQLENRLADPEVILNSFIIANTRYEQVDHWLTPGTGQRMSKAAFEARHVLFQNEDKATYIAKLLKKACSD